DASLDGKRRVLVSGLRLPEEHTAGAGDREDSDRQGREATDHELPPPKGPHYCARSRRTSMARACALNSVSSGAQSGSTGSAAICWSSDFASARRSRASRVSARNNRVTMLRGL